MIKAYVDLLPYISVPDAQEMLQKSDIFSQTWEIYSLLISDPLLLIIQLRREMLHEIQAQNFGFGIYPGYE